MFYWHPSMCGHFGLYIFNIYLLTINAESDAVDKLDAQFKNSFVQPPFSVVKILVIRRKHRFDKRGVIIVLDLMNCCIVDNLIVPHTQIRQADKAGTTYTDIFLQRIVKNQKFGTVIFDFDLSILLSAQSMFSKFINQTSYFIFQLGVNFKNLYCCSCHSHQRT